MNLIPPPTSPYTPKRRFMDLVDQQLFEGLVYSWGLGETLSLTLHFLFFYVIMMLAYHTPAPWVPHMFLGWLVAVCCIPEDH